MLDFLTSWTSITLSGICAAIYLFVFLFPETARKSVKKIKKLIRNILRSNRAFMAWLNDESLESQIQADYSAGNVKLHSSWRKEDYK